MVPQPSPTIPSEATVTEIRAGKPRNFPLWLSIVLVFLGGFAIGGALMTYSAAFGWDDVWQHMYSKYVLSLFHLYPEEQIATLKLYGPLTELFLGIATEYIFYPLQDPYWVRHALVFALFPTTLFLHFVLLRKNGISLATALLATCCVFGVIRFGGHALVNVKDFPAASAYLIITLIQWQLFRFCFDRQEIISTRWLSSLVLLGMVSVVPYLMRTPLLLHFVMTSAACILVSLLRRDMGKRKRLLLAIIPIISGILTISLLLPSVWSEGFFGSMEKTLSFYSHHPRGLTTRVFGMQFTPEAIPRWYALAWIIVIAHPAVTALALLGIILPFIHHRKEGSLLAIPTSAGTWHISLHLWMWIVTLLSFLAVIVISPNLYNEERHILFLYPILFSAAALGLGSLRKTTKYWLSTLIVIVSLLSYASWGKYSYIYINPLLGMTNKKHFTGDYWEVCMPHAILVSQENAQSNTRVYLRSINPPTYIQLIRLRQGTFFQDRKLARFRSTSKRPERNPYFAISNYPDDQRTLEDIETKKASLVWGEKTPLGEYMCLVARYQ